MYKGDIWRMHGSIKKTKQGRITSPTPNVYFYYKFKVRLLDMKFCEKKNNHGSAKTCVKSCMVKENIMHCIDIEM